MKQVLLFFFIFFPILLHAEPQPFKQQGFVILLSTKSYTSALNFVKKAKQQLALKLELRDLKPHSQTGLSYSKQVCESELAFSYPCYTSRGRYDDGAYLSIEHSSAYPNFSPGYYIVIAASGDPQNLVVQKTLKAARKFYHDAYIKKDRVYLGCIH